MNPFNGIERRVQLYSVYPRPAVNPFNGIESLDNFAVPPYFITPRIHSMELKEVF